MSDEIIDVTPSLPAVRPIVAPSLLGKEPDEVVERAVKIAKALAPIVRSQKLYSQIGGRNHVHIEAWTTLGAMVGVFPSTLSVEWIGDHTCRAVVEARTLAGDLVGRASAMCSREERNWERSDAAKIESMAQTRAASKALRMPLGFIMVLAGYEATPAEEMGEERQQDKAGEERARPTSEEQAARGKRQTGRAPSSAPDRLNADGTWPYGTHKGTPVGELPNHFLKWAAESLDKPVLRAVAATELKNRSKEAAENSEDVQF